MYGATGSTFTRTGLEGEGRLEGESGESAEGRGCFRETAGPDGSGGRPEVEQGEDIERRIGGMLREFGEEQEEGGGIEGIEEREEGAFKGIEEREERLFEGIDARDILCRLIESSVDVGEGTAGRGVLRPTGGFDGEFVGESKL